MIERGGGIQYDTEEEFKFLMDKSFGSYDKFIE